MEIVFFFQLSMPTVSENVDTEMSAFRELLNVVKEILEGNERKHKSLKCILLSSGKSTDFDTQHLKSNKREYYYYLSWDTKRSIHSSGLERSLSPTITE